VRQKESTQRAHVFCFPFLPPLGSFHLVAHVVEVPSLSRLIGSCALAISVKNFPSFHIRILNLNFTRASKRFQMTPTSHVPSGISKLWRDKFEREFLPNSFKFQNKFANSFFTLIKIDSYARAFQSFDPSSTDSLLSFSVFIFF
jgi:hypothetical protein